MPSFLQTFQKLYDSDSVLNPFLLETVSVISVFLGKPWLIQTKTSIMGFRVLFDSFFVFYVPIICQEVCCCCFSVTQWCLIVCDPMDCSTPGLPVPPISWMGKFVFIVSVMLSSHLILWCPLLFCPQSFPASGTFPMSCLFISDDQNTGISASASVLPVNIQGWSPLSLTGLISLLSKGLSGVFSSTTVQRHQFFGVLPSSWSNSHNHTWPLGRPQPWPYGLLLAE